MSAPSLSEQPALVAADPALAGQVTAMEAELTALREQVAELQRQLGRHSGNSGQPPSQDGPQAPPRTRSRRRSQGCKPGGQPGHAGRTRLQSQRVDDHRDHWPTRCGGCGTRTRAAFPEGVDGPVRFGPRLEALAACLRYVQHLPTARLRDLLRELHGVALSTGTVEALCRRAAARLAARAAQLGEQALALPVACMDETSLRVAGERVWLHVLCDGTLTCYRLGGRGGTAVHDRFVAYWSRLPAGIRHAVCNAHLLRNLEEIVEREPTADSWAARMQRLLREARDTARDWFDETGGPVPEAVRAATKAAWDALLEPVLAHYEELPRPARGRRRGHNLALALWELRDDCLRFMADPAVPSPHNRAERALRMARLQMKISGGFRTPDGAARFARMRGVIETARQRGQSLLDLLRLDPDEPWPDAGVEQPSPALGPPGQGYLNSYPSK